MNSILIRIIYLIGKEAETITGIGAVHITTPKQIILVSQNSLVFINHFIEHLSSSYAAAESGLAMAHQLHPHLTNETAPFVKVEWKNEVGHSILT